MHTHKTFIKTYLGYPTKTEQFVSFKKFGDEVMNLEHAHDRGILTGEKNVRNLEQKLSKVVHVYLISFKRVLFSNLFHYLRNKHHVQWVFS